MTRPLGTHVPMYPPVWPLGAVRRCLGVITDRGTIATETGQRLHYKTAADLHALMFDHDLQLWSGSILRLDVYQGLRAMPGTVVTCTKEGAPLQLRLRNGRKVRTITSAAMGLGITADPAALPILRRLFTFLGIPDMTTSGAIGQATIRQSWPSDLGPVSRPHAACFDFVRDRLLGGRVDSILLGRRFRRAFEADINNAYLAEAQRLPGGTAAWYSGLGNEPADMVTGLFDCTIILTRDLPLGPFGIRVDGRTNDYPAKRGAYHAPLWFEDVALLREDGHTVILYQGWYWRSWTTALASWARRMHNARRTAPTDLAPFIKKAIVAAIGRFGAARERYVLADQPGPGDKPVVDPQDGPVDAWVHTEPSDRGECQVHWASYILAGVRRRVWQAARPHAEAGTLIATNYDAIYTTDRPAVRPSTGLGGWKVKVHHDAISQHARWWSSKEAGATMPGVPLASRPPP